MGRAGGDFEPHTFAICHPILWEVCIDQYAIFSGIQPSFYFLKGECAEGGDLCVIYVRGERTRFHRRGPRVQQLCVEDHVETWRTGKVSSDPG